jgi:hypothetical protein
MLNVLAQHLCGFDIGLADGFDVWERLLQLTQQPSAWDAILRQALPPCFF